MAMLSDIFSDIGLASRRWGLVKIFKSGCSAHLQKTVNIAQLVPIRVETVALIDKVQPQLVVNLALPYGRFGDYGCLS